ncbi:MAG: CRTAC1 family protein [Planctomycetota bacterium]|jgi:hypothetical protein
MIKRVSVLATFVAPWLFAVLALAAGCGADDADKSRDRASAAGGFVDTATATGPHFKMSFLPGEQGANFKINLYDHGSGVAVADCNGDGHDDLYFCNQLGPNKLFHGNGDGTFRDMTEASGPVGLGFRISVTATFNDIDNDGDQDLFVTSTRGGNVLFKNDGTGRFTDVTEQAGVAWVGHSQGATFFDADNDGDLDLFVTNTARWTTDVYHPRERYYEGVPTILTLMESVIEHNVFYLNRGDGTFTNATKEANLAGVGWGGDTAVFDYDEDGDSDLFVCNMFGQSLLYRNDGKARFEMVTREALGKTPWGSVCARAFDIDNDARLDLYVVDMHSDMWMPIGYPAERIEESRKYNNPFGPMDPGFDPEAHREFMERASINMDDVFFGNGLYRNKGGGRFEEISDKAGAETFFSWGIADGDFDNDGDVDMFLASGMGFPYFYRRSYMLMNDGAGTFSDASGTTGIDPPPGGKVFGRIAGRESVRSARSAAVLDVDGDGRLDLVVNNFNSRANLFVNRWPQRSWVGLRLTGTKSNRDAIGAVVRVKVGGKTLVRIVQAAGGYLAQSSKTLHFGLGDAAGVESCEIRWPSGRVQALELKNINRVHAVTEPTD